MSIPNHNRRHFRAPLAAHVLYLDEDYVHKARIGNISEGGLFLDRIPYIPKSTQLYFVLEIPTLLNAQNWSEEKTLRASSLYDGRQIFRCQGQIKRKVEQKSEMDELFGQGVGVQLENTSVELKVCIRTYVEHFTRNIVHLLSLFESSKTGDKQVVRKLATLLGYPGHEKISKLRQLVLHDYQSLHQS